MADLLLGRPSSHPHVVQGYQVCLSSYHLINCDVTWMHTLRRLLASVKKSRRCIHLCGNLSERLGHGVDFSARPIGQLRGAGSRSFCCCLKRVGHHRRLNQARIWPVVSTGRTTQAQGYRPGLVGPVLVGFQASLALLSNQALWWGCRNTCSSVYCISILGVGVTTLG
jgi:hypothetical protein